VVVPYQYTMLVWAILLGYVVFGDVPDRFMLAAPPSSWRRGFISSIASRSWARDQSPLRCHERNPPRSPASG
jgi:drug/metabolite transporter (DMT)-like permease